MTVQTEHYYTGNNSTTSYAYTFPYYKTSDIKVTWDGVLKTESTHYNVSGTNIVFTSGNTPGNNVSIHIYRETDVDTSKATFAPGSSIRATDLNNNELQLLYHSQEQNYNKIQTGDIKDGAITSAKILDGTIDTADIADNAITAAKIGTNTITADNLAESYYTEAEADARFYNLASAEEIQSGETWVASDNKIATTSAIDARIVDLLDDVGGFVPIANELSFPNANPDASEPPGAGTIVSINATLNSITTDGTGAVGIQNGTVGNSVVTITGLPANTTYDAGQSMLVETTSTLNTYTFHRFVPKATEVTAIAGKITELGILGTADAVADMNTLGTTAIVSDLDTLADISSNITTVAGVSSNVTTVAGISSNVTTVANNNSNVTTVAGKATEIGRLGTADAVADMNTLGTAAVVEDMNLLGTASCVADMAALGESAVIADMATIADTSNLISNIGTVADIQANVTTVAGIQANVTSVANNATNINAVAADATDINTVAGKATEIGLLGTSAVITDLSILGTADVVADLNILGTADVVSDLNTLGTADVVSDMNTLATTSNVSNISTCAGSITNINNAPTHATNAATSATNAASSATTAEAHKVATAGIHAQAESGPYNVNSNQDWGSITDLGGSAVFSNETSNTLLTMSEGSSTYNYAGIT